MQVLEVLPFETWDPFYVDQGDLEDVVQEDLEDQHVEQEVLAFLILVLVYVEE